jgi:hypothetical protein
VGRRQAAPGTGRMVKNQWNDGRQALPRILTFFSSRAVGQVTPVVGQVLESRPATNTHLGTLDRAFTCANCIGEARWQRSVSQTAASFPARLHV